MGLTRRQAAKEGEGLWMAPWHSLQAHRAPGASERPQGCRGHPAVKDTFRQSLQGSMDGMLSKPIVHQ
ncbi:hypothetical protein CLOM_g5952 [Closterium sp. NIES-68]|nr:hypothetical protein CLOM_g5952 [Closterium sp. NIES-68]